MALARFAGPGSLRRFRWISAGFFQHSHGLNGIGAVAHPTLEEDRGSDEWDWRLWYSCRPLRVLAPCFRSLASVSSLIFFSSFALACQDDELAQCSVESPACDCAEVGGSDVDDAGVPRADDAEDRRPVSIVQFSEAAGTYVEPFWLELSVGSEEAVIRYTLDGSLPTRESAIASSPILIESSVEVRARSEVTSSGLIGSVSSSTYVLVGEEFADFTSNLPIVVIQSAGELPLEKSTVFEPGTLLVQGCFAGDRRVPLVAESTLNQRLGVHVRGSSSAAFPKRPYRVELWSSTEDEDRAAELLGMPASADWVMWSGYTFDRAFMRNALVYKLSNAVGRYAARTQHAEVFFSEEGDILNGGDYRGVYLFVESIKEGAQRVDLSNTSDAAVDENDVGFIFKVDRRGHEKGFDVPVWRRTYWLRTPLVHVHPREEDITDGQLNYLQEYLEDVSQALEAEDGIHPETELHYSEYIDVDSFIDNHILNVFTRNPDSFSLSSFMHKPIGGKLKAGPVWDFDRAMDPSSDSRAASPEGWADRKRDGVDLYFSYGLWRPLFRHEAFADAYWARWKELLDGALAEEPVLEAVDEFAWQLQEAAPRNYDRWPRRLPRGGSFSKEVDRLKDWLSARIQWLEGCVEQDDPIACPDVD